MFETFWNGLNFVQFDSVFADQTKLGLTCDKFHAVAIVDKSMICCLVVHTRGARLLHSLLRIQILKSLVLCCRFSQNAGVLFSLHPHTSCWVLNGLSFQWYGHGASACISVVGYHETTITSGFHDICFQLHMWSQAALGHIWTSCI